MTSGDRLRLFREKTGYNQTQFAKILNVPPRNWSRYEADLTNPPPEVLMSLAGLGLNLHWHLTGEGEMNKESGKVPRHLIGGIPDSTEKVPWHPKNILQTNQGGDMIGCELGENEPQGGIGEDGLLSARMGEVPLIYPGDERDISVVSERTEAVSEAVKRRFPVIVDGDEKGVLIPVVDQGLSAGFGFDYDEGEVVRYIKIPAWIARKGRDLAALPVYGDSMEPTIGRGDLAVCVSGVFKDDGIYVLRDDNRGLMFCKRVKWVPSGWTIMSDNPRYEPMKVDDRAIQIVARVIAAVKEVK
jgi:transcriptional regulator with XRE-family HTH domain/SOS-response transcriptional repressor LexA